MRRSRSIFGLGVMTVGDGMEAATVFEEERLSQVFIEVGLSVLPIFPPAPSSPCVGGGTVNGAADPAEGTPLDGSVSPLLIALFNFDLGQRAYSYLALPDAADYYAGFKEPRILTLGRPRRAMSDRFGGFQTSSIDLVLADHDRAIRARMKLETMLNREFELWMLDDPTRRAESPARRVGHYVITNYEPLGDFTFRITGSDFIGSEISGFWSEFKLDIPKFSRVYFQQLPQELEGKDIPPYYGFVSDESLPTSSGDPVVLNPSAAGYGGDIIETVFPRFGWEVIGGTAPTSLSFVEAAGGSFSNATTPTLYGLVTAVIGGQESDPYPLPPPASLALTGTGKKIQMSTAAVTGADAYRWYLSDVPIGSHHSLAATFAIFQETATNSVEFTSTTDGSPLSQFAGPMWAVVIARMADGLTVPQSTATLDTGVAQHEGFLALGPYADRGTVIAWDPTTPDAEEYWIYLRFAQSGSSFAAADSFIMRFKVPGDQTAFTYHYGDLGERVSGLPGTETELGGVPAPYVGEWVNPDGVTRSAFVLAFGTLGNVQSSFGSDGQSPTAHRVKIAEALYGVSVFCPYKTGWLYPNNYVEVTGTDGAKLWLTMMFVDPSHPIAIAAKDGTIPITANICGWTTNSDGTGNTISSGPRQVLHLLTNCGPRSDGAWRSGDWLEIPVRNGVPVYRSSSFETVKTQTEALIDGGFECAWGLGVVKEVPGLWDFLAAVAINLHIRWFINEHGQIGIKMLDTEASGVAAFTDSTNIPDHGPIVITPGTQDLITRIRYVFKQNYIASVTNPTPGEAELLPPELAETPDWYSGFIERIIDASEAPTTPGHKVKKPLDLQFAMHRDGRAPAVVVGRLLSMLAWPRERYRFPASLLGADITQGDIVEFTHEAGAGASGATSRRIYVDAQELEAQMDLEGRSAFDVYVEGEDITDLVLGGGSP